MNEPIDISGRVFWRLTVVSYVGKSKWLCKCQCGAERVVATGSLNNGSRRSCGCLRDELAGSYNLNHGHSSKSGKSPTYLSWQAMHRRCRNPNHDAFQYYGGRGISVCDEWMDFGNFLADMGERPSGLTIGRINNDGNYCKENCRWETRTQQANSRRTSHMLTVGGHTKTIAQWAFETGKPPGVIFQRLKMGWSDSDAVTKPTRIIRKKSSHQSIT